MPEAQENADLLYGAAAIAAYLNVDISQARHLCRREMIPSFKMGDKVCARRSSIDQYLVNLEAEANGKRQKA